MKRGVLVGLLLVTVAACTRQRDRRPAPAGARAEVVGAGAGATPRGLPTVGAVDAGAGAAKVAAGPAVALDGGLTKQSSSVQVPDPTTLSQQLDARSARRLGLLGGTGSSGSAVKRTLDNLASGPDLDLALDRLARAGGTGTGTGVGVSGGSIRPGVGRVLATGTAGGPAGAGGTPLSGPRARITVEAVTVVAGDVPDALAGVMQRFSGVRACYQRQLSQAPTLAGKLQVNIVVGDAGAVQSASVQPDGLDDLALVRCVGAVMQRITFTGASTDAELQVTFILAAES